MAPAPGRNSNPERELVSPALSELESRSILTIFAVTLSPSPVRSDIVSAPRVKLPLKIALFDNRIFPVLEEPRESVCLLVVASVPLPVIYRALFPLFADIVAVGVPPATLIRPNLAEEVAVPPTRTSTVSLPG